MNRSEAFYEITRDFVRSYSNLTLVDCCCGDGKIGSEFRNEECIDKIVFVDIKEPRKFKINNSLIEKRQEHYLEGIDSYNLEDNSFLIGVHTCGSLADKIIEKAVSNKKPLAIIPCCYNHSMKKYSLIQKPDGRKLMYDEEKDYYDAFRIQFLKENGYEVVLKHIDKKISPMNNLIIGLI